MQGTEQHTSIKMKSDDRIVVQFGDKRVELWADKNQKALRITSDESLFSQTKDFSNVGSNKGYRADSPNSEEQSDSSLNNRIQLHSDTGDGFVTNFAASIPVELK